MIDGKEKLSLRIPYLKPDTFLLSFDDPQA